jgi:hypothetical protein
VWECGSKQVGQIHPQTEHAFNVDMATPLTIARPPDEVDDWVAFYVNMYLPRSEIAMNMDSKVTGPSSSFPQSSPFSNYSSIGPIISVDLGTTNSCGGQNIPCD